MQPYYGPKTILGGALLVLALALFIPFSTNLIQQRISTTPQANIQTQIPETSISLVQHQFDCTKGDPQNGIPAAENCNQILPGRNFAVDVQISSDIDAANLVNVSLNYPAEFLSVERVVTQGSEPDTASGENGPEMATDFFIGSWVNRNYNNDQGTVRLSGAVPNPGFMTSAGNPATMARVYFKLKTAGNPEITVAEGSAIYRNADNANILKTTRNFSINSN